MIGVYVSLAFLIVNVLILLAILALNRRAGARSSKPAPPPPRPRGEGHLDASDILKQEFEYARITASEAMQDRHTMVNFYLLAVGVVASGVVAVLGQDSELPKATGTALLWLLCCVGWLYFLKLVRLRQAWHDSARTMNRIKDFYVEHARDFEPEVLRSAFRWQSHTLPDPDKPWTVYFYSATLIGLLDSAAYAAGGALLGVDATRSLPWRALVLLVLFGLVFFTLHVWLYFAFLRPEPSSEAARGVHGDDE
jgi:hypothetical protein